MVDIVEIDEDAPDKYAPFEAEHQCEVIPVSRQDPDTEILTGIKKLQGRENYSVWKFQMRNLLNYEDLWEPIVGYPDGDTTDEATKKYKDSKALARINLMIGVRCIGHTMRARSAAEAWHALEKVYEEKGRIHLFQKLFSVQRKDYNTIEDYINQVIWLSEILAENGSAVDSEILGVILLRGLPAQDYNIYKPLILEAESSGKTISSDLVISWFMLNCDESDNGEEEDIVEEKDGFGKWITEKSTIFAERVVKTITFTSRARAVRDAINNRRNRRKVCFNCRQPGHIAAQCPNNGSNQQSNSQYFAKQIVSVVVDSAIIKGLTFAGGAVGGAVGSASIILKKVFLKR